MSQQGLRQASVRAVTGTALDYNGDWHALFDLLAVAAGDFNGRMLAWVNQKLGTSYADLPGAQQALAAAEGATNFSSLGSLTVFDAVVDGVNGNDGNAGTLAAPWATTAPLITAIQALGAGEGFTALIKSATYNASSHLRFSASPATGVYATVYVEAGTIFQGDNGVDASFVDVIGTNAWTFEIVGMGAIKGASQPRITRWNAGTGNGLGARNAGNLIVRNLKVDDCVDGWSMHNTGNSDVYDLVISNCNKAPFTHVHTGGRCRAYRCDFTAAAGATLGVGSDTHSGAALPSEYYSCTFTPAANLQILNLGTGAIVRDSVIGTMTTSVTLTPATTNDIRDSFLNLYIDGNNSADFKETWGYFTERHRNGGVGITHENFHYDGGASGAIADAFIASNFNPGANGSPKTAKNGIITGYAGTGAIGSGMDATTAAQFINGGGTVAFCCLNNNSGGDFDAQVSADAGFATAMHDNVTFVPQVGSKATTARAAWAITPGGNCAGAGEGGANIGFAA